MSIHDKIAEDISTFGGLLRCSECAKEKSLSKNDIARYMANGWPKCCDYTMTWITENQLKDNLNIKEII